jgi:YidC/Oxa1 family membrane protein insertase
MFGNFFQLVFYQPVLNLLVFLYSQIGDLGIAIILLTIIIKLIFWPLSQKSTKSQLAMQGIQTELNDLKKKHADNKEELGKATLELYKKHKINPLSSCLPLLIQLPFIYAIFTTLRVGLSEDLDLVYSFINPVTTISTISFGVDLGQRVIILAVLAGLAQFIQSKLMLKKQVKTTPATKGSGMENMAEIMGKQSAYLFPIMTIFFGMSLPGGLTLYWFIFTLLTILQQVLVQKKQDRGPIEGVVISEEK